MGRDPIFRAAQLALVLTLAVVVAAAGIRHGVDPSLLRPVHRVAATLVVPVTLWMVWKSFRPAALLALLLTGVLSAVGIAGGQTPPAWMAATNLLGGLLLATVFAWLAGKRGQDPFLRKRGQDPFSLKTSSLRKKGPDPFFALFFALGLIATQVALGAWISVTESQRLLPLHGLLAMLVAAVFGWLALARVRGIAGKVLFAAAILAPIAGMTSLQYEGSSLAALVHASAAALFVCVAAYAAARRA